MTLNLYSSAVGHRLLFSRYLLFSSPCSHACQGSELFITLHSHLESPLCFKIWPQQPQEELTIPSFMTLHTSSDLHLSTNLTVLLLFYYVSCTDLRDPQDKGPSYPTSLSPLCISNVLS